MLKEYPVMNTLCTADSRHMTASLLKPEVRSYSLQSWACYAFHCAEFALSDFIWSP